MDRIKVTYQFSEIEPWNEVAIAALSEIGFDSFVELENGVEAYINENEFNEQNLEEGVLQEIKEHTQTNVFIEKIPFQNWNAVWESDFKPVFVEDKLTILAPFHDESLVVGLPIIIQPQMSFGTGHHQTTWMMSKILLDMTRVPGSILDMGTGTGVLAILAEKLGAQEILAIDIEPWSVDNTIENSERNNCHNIKTLCGDIDLIEGEKFDLILANINKNILKSHMKYYAEALVKNSKLALSGFFDSDSDELILYAEQYGLIFDSKIVKETWAALILIKN
jgi:ribosomal protein L11 methyltransferase